MNLPLSTFDFRLSARASRGFTLVELLVSIGLMMVMTGAVLANYRTFDTNAKFANASEDIVLAFRQAQVYGVGTKGNAGSCGTSVFTCPYGVYFLSGASNIIVFADVNGNQIYDAGDTAVETIKWENPISISRLLCDGVDCSPSNAGATFKRPNPDAVIKNSSGTYATLSVILKDTNSGKTATTTITNAGQISLQ